MRTFGIWCKNLQIPRPSLIIPQYLQSFCTKKKKMMPIWTMPMTSWEAIISPWILVFATTKKSTFKTKFIKNEKQRRPIKCATHRHLKWFILVTGHRYCDFANKISDITIYNKKVPLQNRGHSELITVSVKLDTSALNTKYWVVKF